MHATSNEGDVQETRAGEERPAGNVGEEGAPIDICTQESDDDSDHHDGKEPDRSAAHSLGDEEDAISSDEDTPQPHTQQPQKQFITTAAFRSAKDVIDLLEDESELEDDVASAPEDEIEEDTDDDVLEVLFQTPAVEPTTASAATLTAEDAQLDPVAIALKYAFGFSAFRGEQQVCTSPSPTQHSCIKCVHTYVPCKQANFQHTQACKTRKKYLVAPCMVPSAFVFLCRLLPCF